MTNVEFVEITSEIEKFFEKELTTEQRRIWFNELKNLTKERYKQIARECYKISKFMPKLADITGINRTVPSVVEKSNSPKCKCNRCNSTGIVIYEKTIDGYTYSLGARCSCKNGNTRPSRILTIDEIDTVL